jgi:medium-chain acyl-[acyl-carrier-protein] hydrolase
VSSRARVFRPQEEPSALSPSAVDQLFVLPHAGGAASYYRQWSEWLPNTIELLPLDLPGHGLRRREGLITEWPGLAADLASQVRARIAGTYVLAGHSLGALLAYEVARIMQAQGAPPSLLLVTGRNGPTAGLSHRPIHQLPDAEFLDALERLGGTPGTVLQQPQIMQMYLPLLRADLRLAETYTREPGPVLSLPVAVFGGRQDRLIDERGLVAWSRETTGTFELTLVAGGHFFHQHPGFATAVRSCLDRLGRGQQPCCRSRGAPPEVPTTRVLPRNVIARIIH